MWLLIALIACGGPLEDARAMDLSGDHAGALAALEAGLAEAPTDAALRYEAGVQAWMAGRHQAAARHWEALVEAHPADWRGWSKLVQVYQRTGDRRSRDRARARLVRLAVDGKVERAAHVRDHIELGDVHVMVHEVLAPTDTLWAFQIYREGVRQDVHLVFHPTSAEAMARKLGEIGPDQRLFALDAHGPGQQLVGMVAGKPGANVFEAFDYDEVRDLAVAWVERWQQGR